MKMLTWWKEFYIKNRLTINIVLLSVMFFANCFCKEVAYGAFSVLILLVLLDSLENGLSYIFFSVPFFYVSLYISAMMFFAAAALYIIKFFIIQFFVRKEKINWWAFALCALCLVFCAMPIGTYNFNWVYKFFTLFFVFALLFAISVKNQKVFRWHFNFKLLSLAVIVMAAFGTIYLLPPYLGQVYHIESFADVKYLRYMGLLYQPNFVAMFSYIPFAILAYFIISGKAKWQDWVLFALLSVVGFSSFSKTFLIIFALILLSLFVWALIKNWKVTLGATIVFAALVTILYFAKPDIFQSYVGRFFGEINSCQSATDVMNKLTTGRYSLWVEMGQYLGSHPLQLFFGRGLGAAPLSSAGPHNTILSMVYQLGIFGSVLFLAPIVLLVWQLCKNVKFSKAIAVPLLLFFITLVEDTIFFIIV